MNYTPIKHIILADGQHTSEISVQDPDEPLDYTVSDKLKQDPVEKVHLPTSPVLTLDRTIRPGARPGMETGQFASPDTRPGLLGRFFQGRRLR